MKRNFPLYLGLIGALSIQGCAKTGVEAAGVTYCAIDNGYTGGAVAGTTGTGSVFDVDPMVASGNAALSPGSTQLGNYTSSVTLSNLVGHGVLKGTYVDVVTDRCGTNYGAFSSGNDFRFAQSDERFAEVMNYYHGNAYRADLAAGNVLYPSSSFLMIANCDVEDNAYYSQGLDSQGNLVDFVCMGQPSEYSTTNFSDDSQVVVHELQHGTTGNAYSTSEDFNKLNYDEAGAINEAVSDFVALMQSDTQIVSPFLNTEFSRWGLGQFFNSGSLMRGAAKCPVWTPHYPNCVGWDKSTAGFSANDRRISFTYPHGLGWPYAGPSSSATLREVIEDSAGFEEIHQTAPIITGALFDVYEAIKASTGDAAATRRRMLTLLVETIKTLPKESGANPSPVTMPGFAAALVTQAGTATPGFTGPEETAIANALAARGLTGITPVADGWATVGPFADDHAGIFFFATTGVNNGELAANKKGMIWFDIENSTANTAVAPLIKVTISDTTKARFSGLTKNPGYVSTSVAFVRYGKINGSSIVTAMNDAAPANDTLMSNSYFSDLAIGGFPYGVNSDTALHIELQSGATAGSTVTFQLEITPYNGTTPATVNFPVTFQ